MLNSAPTSAISRKRLWYALGLLCLVTAVVLGIFSENGWLPRTESVSGKRTGWFGKPLASSAPSSWNVFAAPPPSPTPQLSKELIYAGSRLLAVEDANANAAPPADIAVWRPSTGYWYVLGGPGSQQTYFPWGTSGDTPVPGDYDGDGKTDFSIFRSSSNTWWVTKSSDGNYYAVTFGASGDKPAPADYDGDGKTDIAVFRPSTGVWYIIQSST